MKTSKIEGDHRIVVLQMIEEAYREPTWNGTNLRASLRGIPAAAAGWRPLSSRRSIADIVVHCAYWKYALRRRLAGDKRGGFAFPGSNWFTLPDPVTTPQWKSYLALLDEQHQLLCDFLASDTTSLVYGKPATRDQIRRIFGLAIHDAYHTGQIHLIKKLWLRTVRRSTRGAKQ